MYNYALNRFHRMVGSRYRYVFPKLLVTKINEFCIFWAVNVHGAYQLIVFALFSGAGIRGWWRRFLWCFVIWMEGMGRCLVSRMWSLVLGTLASIQSCSSTWIYKQCSTSAREKNDHGLGKKSSNRTWRFFLGTPIHIAIFWSYKSETNIISRNLYYWFLSPNIFFTSIENTSGNRPRLGILWGFSNIH